MDLIKIIGDVMFAPYSVKGVPEIVVDYHKDIPLYLILRVQNIIRTIKYEYNNMAVVDILNFATQNKSLGCIYRDDLEDLNLYEMLEEVYNESKEDRPRIFSLL